MSYPTMSDKKMTEGNSLRILRTTLPKQWIFRHETEDDYGVDVEVELVTTNGEVRGDFFKGQLKGTKKVEFSKDERASVSGIKQSTLRYWIGLSKYVHMFGFLIDTTEEKVYWKPLFWAASSLLDGGKETKTLHFTKHDLTIKESMAALVIECFGPTPFRVLEAHKRLLLRMPEFMDLFENAAACDAWTGPDSDILFRMFIEDSKTICHFLASIGDNGRLFSLRHWYERSESTWGEYPMYGTIKEAMSALIPLVFEKLNELRRWVNESEFYWSTADPNYLKMVKSIEIPDSRDPDLLRKWGESVATIHSMSHYYL